MNHTFHECSDPDCNVCSAGLAFCVVCKCAEGELSTFCLKKPASEVLKRAFYYEGLDFVGRHFVIRDIYLTSDEALKEIASDITQTFYLRTV